MKPPTSHRQRISLLLTSRLRETWSVPRLASTLGISSRTLHRVVRRECGVSPMVFLRRARMAEARARLESPVPGATVTRIALDSGFAHLGRFSQEYAAQFGESPSATLRRAWRGVGADVGCWEDWHTINALSVKAEEDVRRTVEQRRGPQHRCLV